MTSKAKADAIQARIEELRSLLVTLEAEDNCPLPPDHVRVAAKQRCFCDACAARASMWRALQALDSLKTRYIDPKEEGSRWQPPIAV